MAPIEPEILAGLYREHAPALRLYARQWSSSAEDIVQEAFVKLVQQSPLPEQVLPWLYSAVRNAGLAMNRAAVRRRQREERAGMPEAWFSEVDDALDAQDATRYLAELPLEEREVIIARIWGGLTFAEIAELVNCSLPTAHRRFQAGLMQLRERLRWTPTPSRRTTV
jgi:RNA polymerase sigma-70 factor (ECF subfamily)